MPDSVDPAPAPEPSGVPFWLVLVLVGGLIAWNKLPANNNDPKPTTESIATVTASVFPAQKEQYKAICLEAAAKIRNKELTTEEALIKWLSPKTQAARDAANAPFYKKLDAEIPTTFEGKEEAVAKYLELVGRSW